MTSKPACESNGARTVAVRAFSQVAPESRPDPAAHPRKICMSPDSPESLRLPVAPMVTIALLSGLVNLLYLTGSFFMLEVYDRVIPSRSVETLIALGILALVLYGFQGVIEALRSRILTRVGQGVYQRHIGRVFDLSLTHSLRGASSGEASSVTRDLDSVRTFLSGQGPGAFCDLPWIPLYLGICFLFHFWIGVAALSGGAILISLTLGVELATKRIQREGAQLAQSGMSQGDAARRNVETLVALGIRERVLARWSETNERFLRSQQQLADRTSGFSALSKTFRTALQSAVLAIGAYLVINGQATGGIIIASSILVSRALAPVELMIANWKGFLAARQGWKRLNAHLAKAKTAKPPMALPAPTASLSVQSLSVAPPMSQRLTIQDVAFQLKAGQGLGIIGRSASGKSTLARALIGLWPAVRGAVRLDGAEIGQWSESAFGRHVGYLAQEVELFAGTIEENIARFETEPDPESVIAAARKAGIHEMILGLSEGYNTRLGEHGFGISTGQRQRIGLARALYGDPFLVVLDEPNSNLDAEGEAALTNAIHGVRARGGICIVIAHRPSALAAVDMTMILADGRIQAFGPETRSYAPSSSRPGFRPSYPLLAPEDPHMSLDQTRGSLRTHMLTSAAVFGLLVGGIGTWAVMTEIHGAVIAPGQLVVESDVKKVQHPTGGVIGEILVREGHAVKAGQVLVRLDETQTRANLDIVRRSIEEFDARAARLVAEQEGADAIAYPAYLVTQRGADAVIDHLMRMEDRLFASRRRSRDGQKAQLTERITQIRQEIQGLTEQRAAKDEEIALIGSELAGVQGLYEKNLVPLQRVTALQRDKARLAGERGQLGASMASATGKIAEISLQILQIDDDMRSENGKELADIRGRLSEAREKRVAAEDQLKRVDLRAPQDGIVHQMTVHTVGGLVTPNEPAMLIVPNQDRLALDVRIQPHDIDHVRAGQPVVMKFSAFNQKTTPEITGHISRVSADVTADPKTGTNFYTARIGIDEETRGKLGNVTLQPGMPVESFVQTGPRTVISYLTKPIADQISKTWKDK